MNVVDIPQRATREFYEEAASRYALAVRGRAVGVHQIGKVSHPGLSAIRLLVVTDHAGLDNRFFFSARHRLPERYHRLFVDEPFILPAWSLRAMRYTTQYPSRLLAGRNVLQPYTPSDDHDERWCRVLESYCAYAAFAERTRRSQIIQGRETLAVASAFGRTLAQAAQLLADTGDEQYVNAIEALRGGFFGEGVDPVEQVRDAWTLFADAFDRFDRTLRAYLCAENAEAALTTARARLCGDQECRDFNRDYAFRRWRDIDGYHDDLASLGLPFGQLFPAAAHPQAVKTAAVAPIVERLLRGAYHMRRRIQEYAVG